MLSQVHDTKSTSLTIPVLKSSYTRAAAAIEKSKIQDAYFAGLMDWDENRALKLLVTKRTEGWVPDKRSLRHTFTTRSTPASEPATPLPSSGESTDSATVPANKISYTHPESTIEELKIEDAYVGGSITSDEKEGLKMLVTESTEGQRAASTNIGHARHDREQQSRQPERGQSLDTHGMQTTEPPRRNTLVAGGFEPAQAAYSGMEAYRIIPYRRTYRVEAISADGTHKLLDVWSTEEAAVSRLKSLQIGAERAVRRRNSIAKDWRG